MDRIGKLTLNSRLLSRTSGLLRARFGDLFSPSAMVRGCATHATQCSVPGYSYFAMCSEKSKHNCLISYWDSRVVFFNSCTGIKRTHPYTTAVALVVLIFCILNILYIVVGVGKYMDAAVNIGSNPVSKHQIQPECGE